LGIALLIGPASRRVSQPAASTRNMIFPPFG
jgi:hypothetical protein